MAQFFEYKRREKSGGTWPLKARQFYRENIDFITTQSIFTIGYLAVAFFILCLIECNDECRPGIDLGLHFDSSIVRLKNV